MESYGAGSDGLTTRGLMLASMKVINASGSAVDVIVGLDTMSNTTIVESTLVHDYTDENTPVSVSVCGGVTSLGGTGVMKVCLPTKTVPLSVRVGKQKHRPKHAKVLLSKAHIRRLQIDIGWHLSYDGLNIPPVRYKNVSDASEIFSTDMAEDECLPEVFESQ
jgi:hypothetical protein